MKLKKKKEQTIHTLGQNHPISQQNRKPELYNTQHLPLEGKKKNLRQTKTITKSQDN